MIISRYLSKEICSTLLAVTFVLLLILISQQLVRYLSYAASGKIAATLLFKIIMLEIPNLLALLLPLGLFLGIVLTYGRFYADNELRVLHACGFSVKRLMGITSLFALMIAGLVMMLTLWINPTLTANKQKIIATQSADNLLGTLMPGRFQVSSDGMRVVYVEKISRNHHEADNVFVAQQQKEHADAAGTPWVILSAQNGHQELDPLTQQPFIIADNGYRYEGVPGQNNYKIIQFKRYAIRSPSAALTTRRQIQEAVATVDLLKHYGKPEPSAELQWRVAIPLSTVLLALLAVPLSQVKPRQGRYAVFFPAVLIYVIYMNLLFVGRNLIEQKTISVTWGLWWVHFIAIALIIGFLWSGRARKA